MSKKIKMTRKNGGMEKGKEYNVGGKSPVSERAAEILVGNGFAEYVTSDCKGDCDEGADCAECEKQAAKKKAPAKKRPMSKVDSTSEEK